MPIPPDSDSKKRRAMKAATVAASSSGSQMEGTVRLQRGRHSKIRWQTGQEWTSREKRDESSSSMALNIKRRILTKTSTEGSRMDDEGEEGDEFSSSTVPNTRRRIATKTSMADNKSDEKTVAVTTPEALQALTSWGQAAAREDGPVQGELRMTGTRKPMIL